MHDLSAVLSWLRIRPVDAVFSQPCQRRRDDYFRTGIVHEADREIQTYSFANRAANHDVVGEAPAAGEVRLSQRERNYMRSSTAFEGSKFSSVAKFVVPSLSFPILNPFDASPSHGKKSHWELSDEVSPRCRCGERIE